MKYINHVNLKMKSMCSTQVESQDDCSVQGSSRIDKSYQCQLSKVKRFPSTIKKSMEIESSDTEEEDINYQISHFTPS